MVQNTSSKLNTRVFSDIDLSFVQNPINRDIAIIYDEVAIKRSLKNLILMTPFTDYFHPEISSPIGSLLFQNFSPDIVNVLQKVLTNLIQNYEPRVNLLEINITAIPEGHSLNAEIVFTIVNNLKPVILNVLLQRTR